MLNYLRAELYKLFRRRPLYVMTGLLIAGEGLFCLSWAYGWPGAEFSDMVSLMTVTMPVGLYLTIPLAWLAASDTGRGGPLKNEVSFGLSRTRIYLGKLCAAAVVSLLVCGVVFGFYLGSNWLLCTHTDREAEWVALAVLGYTAAASLPLWLGMLGVCMLAFLSLRSTVGAVVFLILGLSLGELLPNLFTSIQWGPLQQLGWLGRQLSLLEPFGRFTGHLSWASMGRDWLLGLGWLAAATAVGIIIFRKREL